MQPPYARSERRTDPTLGMCPHDMYSYQLLRLAPPVKPVPAGHAPMSRRGPGWQDAHGNTERDDATCAPLTRSTTMIPGSWRLHVSRRPPPGAGAPERATRGASAPTLEKALSKVDAIFSKTVLVFFVKPGQTRLDVFESDLTESKRNLSLRFFKRRPAPRASHLGPPHGGAIDRDMRRGRSRNSIGSRHCSRWLLSE